MVGKGLTFPTIGKSVDNKTVTLYYTQSIKNINKSKLIINYQKNHGMCVG